MRSLYAKRRALRALLTTHPIVARGSPVVASMRRENGPGRPSHKWGLSANTLSVAASNTTTAAGALSTRRVFPGS